MIMVDVNVVVDAVQRREPHFRASATLLNAVVAGRVEAAIPAHAVTTLYYLVRRLQDQIAARRTVAWSLRYFQIAPVGHDELASALANGVVDFEDAVVVEAAEVAGCDLIVTRDVRDFRAAPVPSMTPEQYTFILGT